MKFSYLGVAAMEEGLEVLERRERPRNWGKKILPFDPL
jgi:hypothetical protein